MKNIKYIILGITLSVFIFISTNFIYGQWYKDNMFKVDEKVSFEVKIESNNSATLEKIEKIFKINAEDNFSIVVHNNSKSRLNYIEYNFFTTDSDYKNKIITYKEIDFSEPFEIKSGDNILFDPIPEQAIIINNVNFMDMSDNAIILLFNFKNQSPNIINNLVNDLEINNVGEFVSFNELIEFDENNTLSKIYFVNTHIYIFIIASIISILIFKDINNSFKAISLDKIEGTSNLSIYNAYVLKKIVLVLLINLVVLSVISILKYNLSPIIIKLYYEVLITHVLASIILIFILTLPGYFIISNTKINIALKGYNQLKTSLFGLSFLKLTILVLASLMITNYIDIIPKSVEGLLNYNSSIEKYKNLFIINSSLNEDVNQVVEIERIKEKLVNDHEGFSTVCLPEGDSSNYQLTESYEDKMYSSIYYIVDSNINRITVDQDKILDKYAIETFKHYGFDSFMIKRENFNKFDFLYCTRNILNPFNEKLYFKDYDVIKIEVKNIYDHNLNPNFILFKAKNIDEANKIINDIYTEYNEENNLIVESIEDDLKLSYNLALEFIKKSLINVILIVGLLIVLNTELVNNFIIFDREENLYLHLLGKSKLYMIRKYALLSTIIICIYLFIQVFLYNRFNINTNPFMYLFFIIIDLLSGFYYLRKISFRKLRGL